MTSVPYVPNYDKWKRHFLAMATGRVKPNDKGQYIVGSVYQEGSGGQGKSDEPKIKMVTPVAAAIELAKSELRQEREEAGPRKARKNYKKAQPGPPRKKRRYNRDALDA